MNQSRSVYSLNLGGYEIKYSFLVPGTCRIFGNYIKECDSDSYDIRLTRAYMEECRWLVTEDTADDWLEFQSLMLATGNYILSVDRALFHGAAFLWKDKAWILTAPSGTGKTTQLKNWRNLLKKDIRIINGDKPVVTCKDNKVYVSSSPWRGKERLGHPDLSAELGGIILLEQGDRNEITRLSVQEAVHPLFIEFVSYPDTVEQIRAQGQILDRILDHIPVWKLVNIGDMDSTTLTRDALVDFLEAKHE